ncbi:MAG: hypothetical protein WC778_11035 [Negativicutes bacterium]|jgi:hypothetical protein
MKRIALFITENQILKLKEIANGRPISELIRQAIDEFILKNNL